MTTEFTFDLNIISDLHKEAYGYRPSGDFYEQLDAMDDHGKQRVWDGLMEDAAAEAAEEKQREERNVAALEARISQIMELVAGSTRADAIRFLHDAHDTDGDDGYLEYTLGVPYGYLAK